jgi:hypothetical protein
MSIILLLQTHRGQAEWVGMVAQGGNGGANTAINSPLLTNLESLSCPFFYKRKETVSQAKTNTIDPTTSSLVPKPHLGTPDLWTYTVGQGSGQSGR